MEYCLMRDEDTTLISRLVPFASESPSHTCNACKSSLPIRESRCCVLQIAIDVLHLSRLNVRSEVLSILVASQCLLLWLKIQYFAR